MEQGLEDKLVGPVARWRSRLFTHSAIAQVYQKGRRKIYRRRYLSHFLRRTPAIPDRWQFCRHSGHDRNAAAKPLRLYSPAACITRRLERWFGERIGSQ